VSAVYLQQFPSYSNHNCKKSSFLRTPAFIFCLPWGRPCDNYAKRCMNEKTIQCLPNPSQHVPIYIQYFPSYTMLKSMRKSKNHYFYHILVSLWDDPWAITLNVAWMEREFSACQTLRSIYTSIFNSFPVIRTASAKNRRFHVPQPTLLFPWRRPCDYHAMCCMNVKKIQCLPHITVQGAATR